MTLFNLRLETERLILVPFTLELVEALERRGDVARLIGAEIPDEWPDEELAGLVSPYANWLRADPSVLGYGPWVTIARDDELVVGSAGFVGKPDAGGTIELGFGTHAGYRNRGYARKRHARWSRGHSISRT